MADKSASSPVVATTGASAPAVVGTPKKAKTAKLAKPRVTATHPKTAEMVNAAIASLKERGGSSLQAIKKYMVSTYKVDAEKQATFIKKYLKAAVASGALVQTKGKGAAGSFKIGKVETAKPKAKAVTKTKVPKKSPTTKKPAAPKKPTAAVAKKTPTKKAAAAAAVSPKKKVSKGPAAKPPKPKTTKAKPAAAKSPAKTSKPSLAKKTKPVAAQPKKVAPKKTVAAKK